MADDTCESCGERNSRTAQFCSSCGTYLGWGERAAAAAPPPAAAAPVVAAPADAAPAARAAAPAPQSGETAVLERPAPVAAAPPAAPQPPPTPGCVVCGRVNDPARRFCSHCGTSTGVGRIPGARRTPTARHRPWWERLLHRGAPADREALRAYRRSLPLRYKVFRGAVAVALLALVVVPLVLLRGTDPVAFAQARWDDVFTNPQPVEDVVPSVDPAGLTPLPGFEPVNALDGSGQTAWATPWPPAEDVPAPALLLTLPAPHDVRAVQLQSGLAADDPDRALQPRPRVVELRFSDGTWQRLPLEDTAEPRTVALERPVITSLVRIEVRDVYNGAGGTDQPSASIGEVQLLHRPLR